MKNLSIIIPAYNEGERIERTLRSLKETFGDSEIIVVSNGSRDNTVSILDKWCEENNNYQYLDYKEKLGKGGAIEKGLLKASREWVGFLDADDAFDLKEIKEMVKSLEEYDCVISSKWKNDGIFKVDEPFVRKVLSRVWNLMVKSVLGLNFKDTQAGAKFFRKDSLDLDKKFICKDFSFDIELLYRLKDKNIKECQISSKFQEGSKFSYGHAISMLKNLVKLKFSK